MSKKIVFFILLILRFSSGFSQEFYPLSSYGIGELLNANSMSIRAHGNLNATIPNPSEVNLLNPASLGYNYSTSYRPVKFDIGFEYVNGTFSTTENETNFSKHYENFNFRYASFSFPIAKQFGATLLYTPISYINYDIANPSSDDVSYLSYLEGRGGLSLIGINLGYKKSNLSYGLTLGYLFGHKDYFRYLVVNDVVNSFFPSADDTRYTINGFHYKLGLLYEKQLGINAKKQALKYIIGAYGHLNQNLFVQQENIRYTFSLGATRVPIDTSFLSTDRYRGTFPAQFEAGILFKRENKWSIGMDFEVGLWSNEKTSLNNNNLNNVFGIKIGGSIIPNIASKNFFKHTVYRLGINYKNAIFGDGSDVLFLGGFGIPLKRIPYSNQVSRMFIVFEYRVLTGSKPIFSQDEFKVGVSLSISDLWFIKQKYY